MLTFKTTARYRKDYKRAVRRGYDLSPLREVVNTLIAEKPLAPKHHDHELSGSWAGFRECHITPDWLLIYKVDHGALILTAHRTGTHADLLE